MNTVSNFVGEHAAGCLQAQKLLHALREGSADEHDVLAAIEALRAASSARVAGFARELTKALGRPEG